MRHGCLPRGLLRAWRTSPYRPIVVHPVLRRLLPAFAVSALGDGMSAIAVALLAVRLAGPGQAAILVGAAVAAYTLPGALGALLLGRPLRRLSGGRLVTADATLRAAALGTIPVLYAVGGLTGVLYVVLLALSSVLHAWGISGRYTLLAEQLPHTQRLPANALLSVLDQGAVIVGPLLAGLIIAVSNPSLAIAADATSFAVLAVTAWACARRTGIEPTETVAQKPGRTRGFRFIAGHPALLGLLVLSFLFFLFYGPVEVALPLYVLGTLHGSASLLAVFWAVFGTGAVIGAITVGLLHRVPLWPTVLTAVIGWGAALVPLGLLNTAAPTLASFAVGGLLYAPYLALSYTLFQTESPPHLLSQVLAARGALTVLATPVGTALGGPLVVAIGPQATLLASAAATIALGLFATITLLVVKRRPPRAADARVARSAAPRGEPTGDESL